MAEQLVLDFEEWLPVAHFSEYEVSNLGRVRRSVPSYTVIWLTGELRLRRPKGAILKETHSHNGYLVVTLHDGDGRYKTKYIHRLVCAAFNGSPPTPKHHDVAHNYGNPANNTAINLRLATRAENCQDMIRHGTFPRGTRHGHAKLNERAVREIRRLADGKILSWAKIATKFGVSAGSVQDIKNRKTWTWLEE